MTDKIINFYDKLGLIKNSNLPKTWKKHHIYNNSMILCLGGTGSGKSNALVNYIQRSSGEFYKIIICSFSTTDEPLYKMLEGKNVEFILDSESSKLDKIYIEKALVFEKENKCTVFIKTKYHEKLKKEFPNFNRIFDKDQELQNIYASYEIKRHEIETKRQNSFNTHKIWDRSRAAISFNHTENWLEYKQEEVFEDIIYSSYE